MVNRKTKILIALFFFFKLAHVQAASPSSGREQFNALKEQATQGLAALDKSARESGKRDYHVIFIGAGVHNAIIAKQLVNDKSSITFEKSGRISSLLDQIGDGVAANSPSRMSMEGVSNLPGSGDLNNLPGLKYQVAEYVGNYFPMVRDLVDIVRINRAENTLHPILFSTDVIKVTPIRKIKDRVIGYKVTVKDIKTGNTDEYTASYVVDCSGLPMQRGIVEGQEANAETLTAEDLFDANGNARPLENRKIFHAKNIIGKPEVFKSIIGKKVGIIGAKDMGAVTAEWLLRMIPRGDIYAETPSQLGDVESICWVGQDAETCAQYIENNRARYSAISVGFRSKKINPKKSRAEILKSVAEMIVINNETAVDVVILATGLAPDRRLDPGMEWDIIKLGDGIHTIASKDRRFFYAGIKLTASPLFSDLKAVNDWNTRGVSENLASIWLLSPLSLKLGEYLNTVDPMDERTRRLQAVSTNAENREKNGQEIRIADSTFAFVQIPDGKIVDDDREIDVKGFVYGAAPLTNAQFASVISRGDSDNYPHIKMNRDKAGMLITAINDKLKRGGFESKVRLPTNKEWELAAIPQGIMMNAFLNGKPLTDFGWFAENSSGAIGLVSRLLPTPPGLYDMFGTVWELTSTQCEDENGNEGFIIRGGSYRTKIEDLIESGFSRCQTDFEDEATDDIGVRLVLVPGK